MPAQGLDRDEPDDLGVGAANCAGVRPSASIREPYLAANPGGGRAAWARRAGRGRLEKADIEIGLGVTERQHRPRLGPQVANLQRAGLGHHHDGLAVPHEPGRHEVRGPVVGHGRQPEHRLRLEEPLHASWRRGRSCPCRQHRGSAGDRPPTRVVDRDGHASRAHGAPCQRFVSPPRPRSRSSRSDALVDPPVPVVPVPPPGAAEQATEQAAEVRRSGPGRLVEAAGRRRSALREHVDDLRQEHREQRQQRPMSIPEPADSCWTCPGRAPGRAAAGRPDRSPRSRPTSRPPSRGHPGAASRRARRGRRSAGSHRSARRGPPDRPRRRRRRPPRPWTASEIVHGCPQLAGRLDGST